MPSSESFLQQIKQELLVIEQRRLLRCPGTMDSPAGKTAVLNGREIRVFCSNNYLDLANDPRVVGAVANGLDRWGWGSGASRLICGGTRAHADLEQQLASFKEYDSAVLFPSGYMANLGVLTALAGAGDVLLIDKLCHASIIDAAGCSKATKRFFAHNDTSRLIRLLERYASARRVFIVTEGIFSMDGGSACLEEIVALKSRYGAVLIVDDAHGTGVLGDHGRGTAELLGVEGDVDVTVATLSKALGSVGGFVCCGRKIAEYLRNRSRSYIYTTAAPAVVCLAGQAALEVIAGEPQRRKNLMAMSLRLRDGLAEAGFDMGSARAHIIPVMLGETELALRASESLLSRGFMIPAIREPSVPKGKARLRISLMSSHGREDIDDLVNALCEVGAELGILGKSD